MGKDPMNEDAMNFQILAEGEGFDPSEGMFRNLAAHIARGGKE
jgi:hypothetical protein